MNNQTLESSNLTQDIKNPKRARIMISVLVLFVVLCIGISFFLLTFFRSPKASVLKAVKHTLSNTNTAAEDYLHTKELRSILADGRYQTTCNLALEDYSFDGIQNTDYTDFITLAPSISVKTKVDYPNKKADSIIDFICGGSSILNVNVYAMNDTIGLVCPALYDGCLSFNTSTLAEDYNQSYLCTFLNRLKLEENVNIDLFNTPYSDKSLSALYSEYYAADNKALYEAMTVKKVKGDTIQIGKKSVSAKGYEITIPREHMEKAIDNLLYLSVHQSESAYQNLRYQLEQYLGVIVLPEEFICTIYVDPRSDTMLKCVHTSAYLVDGISNTVTGSIEWLGEEYPNDIITSAIDITDKNGLQESIACNISAKTKDNIYEKAYAISMNTIDKTSSDKTVDATIKYSIDTNNGALTFHSDAFEDKTSLINFDITGSFTNIEAGKCISLDVDHAVLTSSYASTSLNLTGDYTFESLQTEVATPIETLRPVLEMPEDDFYSFVYEIIHNYTSSPLGSFVNK